MYSLRDSIIKPNELKQRLIELGQNAVAITDHGDSLGGISIYKLMSFENENEKKIKYIHGCEFYICDDTAVQDKNNRYYHLIVLCKNDIGRVNLNRLITISHKKENFYYKPRIDFEILKEHKDGLIVTSACLAGEISKSLMVGNVDDAEIKAIKYKEVFGDDYYIEIQSHDEEKQKMVNRELVKIARKLGISIVVTTDAHYVLEQDCDYQKKYAFNGNLKEDSETYKDCFIQSEDEVRAKINYLPQDIVDEAISNTEIIANKCNVQMPLSDPIMPTIQRPPQFTSNIEWLKFLCIEGFKNKLNIDYNNKSVYDTNKYFTRIVHDSNTGEPVRSEDGSFATQSYQYTQQQIDTYIDRFDWELNSLEKMNFIDYILLVYTYANKGTRRGVARGSGGGSLVNYLSNITDVDPIEHQLYFERFIDVSAVDLLEQGKITAKELKIPDIDLDFNNSSCHDVLGYLYNTYGESYVASIGKFGTNKTNGTIRDMCKALGYSLEEEDLIAKSFSAFEIKDIDAMISGKSPIIDGAKEAINYVKKYPDLFRYVRKLKDLPKSFGLHACGKIIATKDLDEFLPSCYDKDGIRYLQGDMHDVEDVGLVKIDILGLRTLDQEYDTLEQTGEDKDFLNPKQDYSDPKVLEIFNTGDTVGIFQMASYGMKKTLQKMQVRGIEDLAIANALYRPGAMAHIDSFCKRRHGTEKVEYLHTDLKPILESTYGIIIFQEQLIEIGRMAGLHNPDLLRKATGKKDIELLNQVIKPELKQRLIERGWTDEQFEKLWIDIIAFGSYSFNKSHSVAYGIISYMTAKQKAYYPKQFFAGLCNSFIGKSSFAKEEANEIVDDMFKHNIRFARLDYKTDARKCYINSNGEFVYAIPLIKGCNSQIAETMFDISQKEYSHFWKLIIDINDIHTKKYGKKADISQLKTLTKLGYFNDFGCCSQLLIIIDLLVLLSYGTRKSIQKSKIDSSSEIYEIIAKHSTDITKDGSITQRFVFNDIASILNESEETILSLNVSDLSIKSQIQNQKDYLGFAPMPTFKESDRPILIIQKVIPQKRKKDGKQFGHGVLVRSLGRGKTSWFTVFNARYDDNPVKAGDIIRCLRYSTRNNYFTLDNYEKIY